jgi:hypothetical protein
MRGGGSPARRKARAAALLLQEVGQYKLNPVYPYSLQAHGFNT